MLEGCVPWPEELVKLYEQKGYRQDITLWKHFDQWVRRYADRTAIVYQGKKTAYRQMDEYNG
jgi:2,3-dihydroxybenzoate-AMP ligase